MVTKTKPKEVSKGNQKIVIPFCESDLEDLMSGESFKWTFTSDKGEDIDVLLSMGDDSGDEEENIEQEGDDGDEVNLY